MKKAFALLVLLASFSCPALALPLDGRTDKGPVSRVGYVMARGLVNLATLPLEIPRTVRQEIEWHKYLWLISVWPRAIFNTWNRGFSAVTDLAFMPWIMPFTNDLSPLTEHIDLPEYPWQKE